MMDIDTDFFFPFRDADDGELVNIQTDCVSDHLQCHCVSPLSCVMCPHLMFPYLVCFLSLFNVIIS